MITIHLPVSEGPGQALKAWHKVYERLSDREAESNLTFFNLSDIMSNVGQILVR